MRILCIYLIPRTRSSASAAVGAQLLDRPSIASSFPQCQVSTRQQRSAAPPVPPQQDRHRRLPLKRNVRATPQLPRHPFKGLPRAYFLTPVEQPTDSSGYTKYYNCEVRQGPLDVNLAGNCTRVGLVLGRPT